MGGVQYVLYIICIWFTYINISFNAQLKKGRFSSSDLFVITDTESDFFLRVVKLHFPLTLSVFHHCPIMHHVIYWVHTNVMIQVTFLLPICGSIQILLILPLSVDQSTMCCSIHNLWFNPQSVDQSTISRYNHNVWIIQQLCIHLKVL